MQGWVCDPWSDAVHTQKVKSHVCKPKIKPELFLDVKTCLLKPEILVIFSNRTSHLIYRLDYEFGWVFFTRNSLFYLLWNIYLKVIYLYFENAFVTVKFCDSCCSLSAYTAWHEIRSQFFCLIWPVYLLRLRWDYWPIDHPYLLDALHPI